MGVAPGQVNGPDREPRILPRIRQSHPVGVLSVDALLASPMALIGTEDRISETLRERRERWGISYVTVFPEAIEAFAPVVARLSGR